MITTREKISSRLQYTTHIDNQPLLFHHCRKLEHVKNAKVTQHQHILTHKYHHDCLCSSCLEQDYQPAYLWLQEKTGFYPLFMAVGCYPDAQRITGYQNQWKKISTNNNVLFSYHQPPPNIHFSDYMNWHYVLNSVSFDRTKIETQDWHKNTEKSILQPDWNQKRWLTYANNKPGYTQATVKELDLSQADLIRCRNQKTKQHLIQQGFDQQKIIIERWPSQD